MYEHGAIKATFSEHVGNKRQKDTSDARAGRFVSGTNPLILVTSIDSCSECTTPINLSGTWDVMHTYFVTYHRESQGIQQLSLQIRAASLKTYLIYGMMFSIYAAEIRSILRRAQGKKEILKPKYYLTETSIQLCCRHVSPLRL